MTRTGGSDLIAIRSKECIEAFPSGLLYGIFKRLEGLIDRRALQRSYRVSLESREPPGTEKVEIF